MPPGTKWWGEGLPASRVEDEREANPGSLSQPVIKN